MTGLAKNNLRLMEKIECLTQRTMRLKVLFYLSIMAKQQKSDLVEIPFNRQELADYLTVERSAMSAELSKMQKDGLVRYRKNHFELLK